VSTSDGADASGPRSHVLGVIKGFEGLGWQVERYIAGDRLDQTIGRKGREFVNGRSVIARAAGDFGKIALGQLSARRALRELHGRIDWVYERFAAFQSLGAPFQKRGIPWILETQGPMFYEAKAERQVTALTGVARRLELAAYQSCDVLVCVSDALKEILAECGVDERRVVVVPNGVDVGFFDPAKHERPKRSRQFTIGFVGSLDDWQAVDTLMEAVAEVRRGDGLDVSVTVVGSGLMEEAWSQHARRLGLESCVRFLGQRPRHEVPGLIGGFDVGYSGQKRMKIGRMYHSPLKLLEYLAMEVPVIVSEFADAKRLVAHGENGFVFSHERAGTLAEAIRAAVAVRDQLPAMGQRARRAVVSAHSWDARVQYMTERINDLLPQAKRSGQSPCRTDA
jgi:glycosyltransferase involved in cell wall biosynthesis